MINYRKQNVCANCKHVFVRYDDEYAPNDEYYCTLNAPPRPPCMSTENKEWATDIDPVTKFPTSIRTWQVWRAWAEGREVDMLGICDAWEQGEEAAD